MIQYTRINMVQDLGRWLQIMYDHTAETYGEDGNLDINFITALAGPDSPARGFGILKDGVPVGYAYFLLSRDFLRAHIMKADCVAIYVREEFRGIPAVKLLKFSFTELQNFDNVKEIHAHTNYTHYLQKLYSKLGFKSCDVVMRKEL